VTVDRTPPIHPPTQPTTRVTVLTPDGTRLAVWLHEPPTASAPELATVVLSHGWTLSHEAWAPVIDRLQRRVPVRVVSYDQRAHGESSRGRSPADVHALGDDLHAVLQAVAPHEPVVLGGHSMGGMTIMALAGEHPDVVRDRVRGVCLVSTSAGDLTGLRRDRIGHRGEVSLMRLLAHTPLLRGGRTITMTQQRRLLFGETVDQAHIAATRAMVARTRMRTIGRYHAALSQHDEYESLARLGAVPVHVLVGERDRLTPVRHARRLAQQIDGARLDVVPGAGHMLGYEATDLVVQHLVELVEETA
jgi:pimeloyl-ACP methyl ester carboxylesterase